MCFEINNYCGLMPVEFSTSTSFQFLIVLDSEQSDSPECVFSFWLFRKKKKNVIKQIWLNWLVSVFERNTLYTISRLAHTLTALSKICIIEYTWTLWNGWYPLELVNEKLFLNIKPNSNYSNHFELHGTGKIPQVLDQQFRFLSRKFDFQIPSVF